MLGKKIVFVVNCNDDYERLDYLLSRIVIRNTIVITESETFDVQVMYIGLVLYVQLMTTNSKHFRCMYRRLPNTDIT